MIRNQQVAGSSPASSSKEKPPNRYKTVWRLFCVCERNSIKEQEIMSFSRKTKENPWNLFLLRKGAFGFSWDKIHPAFAIPVKIHVRSALNYDAKAPCFFIPTRASGTGAHRVKNGKMERPRFREPKQVNASDPVFEEFFWEKIEKNLRKQKSSKLLHIALWLTAKIAK